MKCTGQADHSPEGIVIFQAISECAKTTHGKASDKGVFSFSGQRKHFSCNLNQFFSDKLSVHGTDGRLIHIKRILAGRHDNGKVFLLCPSLDSGSMNPVCLISKNAMQQIQRLNGFSSRSGCPKVNLSTGRNNLQRYGCALKFLTEAYLNKCHNKNPPVDIYFSLFYALFLRFVNVEFCVPPVPACTPKQFTI